MEIGKQIYSNGILCRVVGTFQEIPKEYCVGLPTEFLSGDAILINENMPLGQEVRLVIGNLVTKGYVATKVDHAYLLIISPIIKPTTERAYFRLPLHVNVHVSKSVVASKDIGGGGLAFLIDGLHLSFPIGELVEVSFELPNGYLFLGTGKITREDALEFIGLTERERGLLINNLYSIQKKLVKGMV